MHAPPDIDPARHALFVDFDGTLVQFVDDPASVAIDDEALDSLTALAKRLDGALAIVSGRRIADLDRLLAPLSFAAAGIHGLEMRPAPGGAIRRSAGPEALERVREALQGAVERECGLRLEDKGTALVLHYREHPELEHAARAAMAHAVQGQGGLKVMNGHRIVEVHPDGMDKGVAVAALMGEPAFRGRVPIYLGDDTTDEFAILAVQKLGGIGVRVGPGTSAAEARLADVPAVHAWLKAGCRLADR